MANSIRVKIGRLMNLLNCHPIPIYSLAIFATNRCNSKCKICGIWREKPKVDLPLQAIQKLLDSKYIDPDRTHISLTGGEFILHPQCDEIIDEIKSRGFEKLTLLTNGLLPDVVMRVVKEHKIKAVNISLDGKPETYKIIRGVDGYSKVLELIRGLYTKVTLTLSYVICQYNNLDDFIHVLNIAKKYNCNLQIIIYEDNKIFGTDFIGRVSETVIQEISRFVDDKINKLYLQLYSKWLKGDFVIPCLSIRNGVIVLPNGDIPLCHCTNIKLGNISEQSLDEILSSKQTKELLKKYTKCNLCWAFCHRMSDLGVLGSFWKRLKYLPQPIRSVIYKITTKVWGNYDYEVIKHFIK